MRAPQTGPSRRGRAVEPSEGSGLRSQCPKPRSLRLTSEPLGQSVSTPSPNMVSSDTSSETGLLRSSFGGSNRNSHRDRDRGRQRGRAFPQRRGVVSHLGMTELWSSQRKSPEPASRSAPARVGGGTTLGGPTTRDGSWRKSRPVQRLKGSERTCGLSCCPWSH